MRLKKWGMAGLAIVTAGAVVFGTLSISGVASAQTPPGPQGPQDGQNRRGQFEQMLAQKLGVSVEQLRAATKATRDQLIDQAVANGRMTKEEGDRLKGMGMPGGGFPGMPGTNQRGPRPQGQGQAGPRSEFRGELRAGFTNVINTLAGSFGMTVEQLREQLRTKSIADIAKEHGRTTDQIENTIMLQVKADIQNAVSAGRLSQRQADLMLRGLDRMIERMVNNKPGQGGPGGFFGPRSGNQGPGTPGSNVPGPRPQTAPQGPRGQ